MSKVYTVGCWECGEFHAFEDPIDAQASLASLKERPVEHYHDGLGVVKMEADRVPLWD
jgi:hypothetical protein